MSVTRPLISNSMENYTAQDCPHKWHLKQQCCILGCIFEVIPRLKLYNTFSNFLLEIASSTADAIYPSKHPLPGVKVKESSA